MAAMKEENDKSNADLKTSKETIEKVRSFAVKFRSEKNQFEEHNKKLEVSANNHT